MSRPTVSIVTPTSNQQWTNGTFTVTGKAGDNVAVGTVYYSLNGSGWTAATTGNNWTNWTANLTLTPGTNTVQAYAVDTSGNFSPTNTVKFVYLVLKPLTVQIGSAGQSANGARQSQLQRGAAGHQRELHVDRQCVLGVCVHQLDGRVRQPADQSCHVAVHDGDELDVDGEFCGCARADVEHCDPDLQPAMDQWNVHGDGQGRRQRGGGDGVLFVERFGLDGGDDRPTTGPTGRPM